MPPQLLLAPGSGILQFGGVRLSNGGPLPGREVALPFLCFGGSDTAFTRAFAQAALQMPELCVAFHWGTEVGWSGAGGPPGWVLAGWAVGVGWVGVQA